MKQSKLLILGLIGILVLIVAASGCTSSNTNSSPSTNSSQTSSQTDLVTGNTPGVIQLPEFEPQRTQIGGLIQKQCPTCL